MFIFEIPVLSIMPFLSSEGTNRQQPNFIFPKIFNLIHSGIEKIKRKIWKTKSNFKFASDVHNRYNIQKIRKIP